MFFFIALLSDHIKYNKRDESVLNSNDSWSYVCTNVFKHV